MKKISQKLVDMHTPATRLEWWLVALLTFIPWGLFAPVLFVSPLFLPMILLMTLNFLMGITLLPLTVLLTLLTLSVFIHVLYIIVSLRRFKDLRMSPLYLLFFCVPFIGVLSQIFLLGFIKGKRVESQTL
jgi:uncharacterized membrane protein YhaH (DUF805 family)